MALSAEDFLYLRDLTGGRTKTSSKDHLTDAQLQTMYDNAGEVWNAAVVYVLRRRIGMASGYVDKTLDLNSTRMAQYVDHLRKLLKDAEIDAGLQPMGTLTMGTLDLNLDTDMDDL